MFKILIIALAAVIVGVQSQSALYGQCGGANWTGAKSCASGVCTYVNDYYSQCLPGSSGQAASTAAPTAAASTTKAATAASTTKGATAASTAAQTTAGSSSSQKCPSTYASKASSFINGKFKVGIDYNYYTGHNVDLSQYDYISIWMDTIDSAGSTAWNPYYQGVMLDVCTKNNKIPLFYAYVIAFEARSKKGLQDCDVGSPNLCQQGAEFIRNNRQNLVNKYTEHATGIAARYGKD